MAGTEPRTRSGRVIGILLWLAGLGVLAENVVFFGRTGACAKPPLPKSLRERTCRCFRVSRSMAASSQ